MCDLPRRVLGMLLCSVALVGRAETWCTLQGDRYEGRLSGVYGTHAMVSDKAGTLQIPIELLDDAGTARIADYLAAKAGTPPMWKKSESAITKVLRNRLQVLRDGKLVAYEPGERAEPEVYLAYFGAQWCGPCRQFSPDLVKAYAQLKKAAGDRFELVFVSSDRDSAEQLRYVKEVAMPWPVLKFSAVGSAKPIEKWSGRGIPCLVALTPDGDLIYHSYRGTEYLGPRHVLQEFSGLVRAMKGESPAAKRAMHRVAVLQHVRAAASGDRAAKPYVISLDPARYQTLEVKEIQATLELDEQGRVAGAKIDPALPVVVDDQLVRDAATWLFLPAVENGRPKPGRVQLPIKF